MADDDELQCDVLLLVTTKTEVEQLEAAAGAIGLPFAPKKSAHGNFFSLGLINDTRVRAVRTQGMGPFGQGGSASRAVVFQGATGATGLIQLGMAFGVDPSVQAKGDVLVSTSLIPYDNRNVLPADAIVEVQPPDVGMIEIVAEMVEVEAAHIDVGIPQTGPVTATPVGRGYVVDYKSRVKRQPASPSLLTVLRAGQDSGKHLHQVFFGAMLSGGALINSTVFLRELMVGVPAGDDPIIGGDMEGVGLLSASPAKKPNWAIVKGIVDFADESRVGGVSQPDRDLACGNAARFVLQALRDFKV